MAGRDEALFAISNIGEPEVDDRRRRFRLKSLNLTPMNFFVTTNVSTMVFGLFSGGYEGGEEVPVVKMNTSAPDLPAGIKVLTQATIWPGYDLSQDIGGLQNYVSAFSEFAFGSRYTLNSGNNSLHLPATGPIGRGADGQSSILSFRGAAASTAVGVQIASGGFAFALKSSNPDQSWPFLWNANVVFTVNGNTYSAVFDFIPTGTTLNLADNAIDVPASVATTVPFMIRNDVGSSHVIGIESIDLLYTGQTPAQSLYVDQTSMRLCRINGVSGGVTVSATAGDAASLAPAQLALRVGRAWSPLVAPMDFGGFNVIGDIGYPQLNQGVVRKINALGRRLHPTPREDAQLVVNTPNFGKNTIRGWEWTYDTAPMISAGESLALIQENPMPWGGWWVDAVIFVDSPPQSSYAFIG